MVTTAELQILTPNPNRLLDVVFAINVICVN